MIVISPWHGHFNTIFHIDCYKSNIDFSHINISVSSGNIHIININPIYKNIELMLTDTTKGSKTITISDLSNSETVNVILELQYSPENRTNYVILNSKRPQYPYRID